MKLLLAALLMHQLGTSHYFEKGGSVYFQQLPHVGLDDIGSALIFGIKPKYIKMPDANAETFVVILDETGKDKNHVYVKDQILPEADPSTIHAVADCFDTCADKNKVWQSGQVIAGADPKSFHAVDDGYTADHSRVYYYGRAVEAADPKSFHLAIKKDPDHRSSENIFADDQHVFRSGYLVKLADPNTFHRIWIDNADDYCIDATHVFCNGFVVNDADPKSFHVLLQSPERSYLSDASKVYYDGKELNNADPRTLRRVGDLDCVADRSHVYMGGSLLRGADGKSFRVLFTSPTSRRYYADDHNVWREYEKIDGADPKTFHCVRKSHGEDVCADKDHTYLGTTRQK